MFFFPQRKLDWEWIAGERKRRRNLSSTANPPSAFLELCERLNALYSTLPTCGMTDQSDCQASELSEGSACGGVRRFATDD
jgi:hypothetical protein